MIRVAKCEYGQGTRVDREPCGYSHRLVPKASRASAPRLGWTAVTGSVALRRLVASAGPRKEFSRANRSIGPHPPHRRGPRPILRHPVDVPSDLVWHRHVLGRARRRPHRPRGVGRRRSLDPCAPTATTRRSKIRWCWPRSTSSRRPASTQPSSVLNATDLAIVQHEYGLYEGPDGDSIVALMKRLTVPVLVVAHTVVSEPTVGQRRVLEAVCRAADVVVVMTQTAHDRLISGFDVDPGKVTVIPHGAATPRSNPIAGAQRPTGQAPRLLTWGLLGPGKGIEWAIESLDLLADLDTRPDYIVAGTTHPKVREHSGEAYREMLVDRAGRSTTGASVIFDDTYRDLTSLTELIQSADLVVLPYDSADQVTSGVLVDAVAAGRPVVSTAFPHAVELLASGAGIVVPQRDPQALAAAIRSVLTDPERRRSDGCRSPTSRARSLVVGGGRPLHPPRGHTGRAHRSTRRASCGERHERCRCGAVVRPRARDDRPIRHVRTRRSCRRPPRARLLHRRRGAPADRRRPRAADRTSSRTISDERRCDSSPSPKVSPAARGTVAPPVAAGTAGAASRTAGAAACGRSGRRRGSPRTTGCGRVRSPTSTTAPRNVRRTVGRWRSLRSVLPRSSPSSRDTAGHRR